MLTVQEVDRLGRNLLDGLIVLNDLFARDIAVKVLEGIAAGEHTARHLGSESIRTIATATKLSVGTVHAVITNAIIGSGSD